jgi:signal transduction histidine kinase
MSTPRVASALEELALRALSRQHPAAYAEVSPALEIIHHSPNFVELLALPPQPLVGVALGAVLEEFIGAEEALRRVLFQDAAEFELERVSRVRPDGQEVFLRFQVTALESVPPGSGLLLLVQDTTAITIIEQHLMQDRNELRLVQTDLAKANTDLQRLSEYKSFLISMVAHDLRSPVNAISGYAELTLEDLLPELGTERTHGLQMVAAMSSRLSRLIDNVLDLDQIERGQLKLRLEPCQCNEILPDVAEELKPLIASRNLSLHWHLAADLPSISADLARLTQIFYNLLSNAVKYTADGGEIRVTTQATPDNLVISFFNSGRGMSETQLKNLFRLYYRTEDARQSKVAGTGLGLFIVKTLVEAHNGQVLAESQVGEGATFTVRLPRNLGVRA